MVLDGPTGKPIGFYISRSEPRGGSSIPWENRRLRKTPPPESVSLAPNGRLGASRGQRDGIDGRMERAFYVIAIVVLAISIVDAIVAVIAIVVVAVSVVAVVVARTQRRRPRWARRR